MNKQPLPPTIEVLLLGRGGHDYERELARAVAHEACRLQREADFGFCDRWNCGVERTQLVVGEP